jgi:hypothetical protein
MERIAWPSWTWPVIHVTRRTVADLEPFRAAALEPVRMLGPGDAFR